MFSTLEEEDRNTIIAAMKISKFKTGQIVITEGESGKDLFLVSDGKLMCTKKDPITQESIFVKHF